MVTPAAASRSCRNARPGDVVTEPALRELYRSGFFVVKDGCSTRGSEPVGYLCLDCGLRFDPEQGLPTEYVGDRVTTLADHAYELPRHRVVIQCSCGALEVR